MRHYYIFLSFFLITFNSVLSQEPDYSIDAYTLKVIPSEFSIRFKNLEEKNSFKLLREFLKEKESLLDALELKLEDYDSDTSLVPTLRSAIIKLSQRTKGKKDDESVEVPGSLLYAGQLLPFSRRATALDSVYKKTVSEINDHIENLNGQIRETLKSFDNYTVVQKNITNVKSDILKCTGQIDSALAPEYQQQNFRKIISISFSVLIGLLLIIFFYLVYKRSDISLSKDLLSGNGLQFITLFVLIIAVILFGILSILGSSELAAILSGISGYILGKGTQKDLSTIISGGMSSQQPGNSLSTGVAGGIMLPVVEKPTAETASKPSGDDHPELVPDEANFYTTPAQG